MPHDAMAVPLINSKVKSLTRRQKKVVMVVDLRARSTVMVSILLPRT